MEKLTSLQLSVRTAKS